MGEPGGSGGGGLGLGTEMAVGFQPWRNVNPAVEVSTPSREDSCQLAHQALRNAEGLTAYCCIRAAVVAPGKLSARSELNQPLFPVWLTTSA